LPTASIIIAAGGSGRRFAAGKEKGPGPLKPLRVLDHFLFPKVFAPLAGRPVLAHTLDRFARLDSVVEVVVAAPAALLDEARQRFGETLASGRRLVFVAGGDDRTESVARALAATDGRTDLVAVHDAVRPLIRLEIIEESFRVAAEHGAAVVGRPLDHTVKSVSEDRRVIRTVPREGLWIVQTPQVFRRDIIQRAYAARGRTPGPITDDAQLVEALGLPVVMVAGDAANFKITTPEDLRLCEALLAAGWPFHR
jgi:2-C-methyl-D-erythritol 4-phosphate cytidylyltransferase